MQWAFRSVPAIIKTFIRTCNRLVLNITNLVYPPRCVMCSGFVQEKAGVCTTCYPSLTFISDPQCKHCGIPFDYTMPGMEEAYACGECIANPPPYGTARSVLVYNQAAALLVHGFKYQDHTYLATLFAEWLAARNRTLLHKAAYLIPVPLHRKRLWERRYNQAALLCHALARHCPATPLPLALLRTKHTPSQKGLSRLQRLKNLRGSIQGNPAYASTLKGSHCVLVDDVMTTSATVQASVRALLKAGAAQVDVLTIARTVRVESFAPDTQMGDEIIDIY